MSRETWQDPMEIVTIILACVSLLVLLLAPTYLITLIREYLREL